MKIETKSDEKIKPVNCCVPVPIPLHLRKAADKELKALLDAGVLEKYHHWTPWLSKGLFVVKKPDSERGEVICRLVADFFQVHQVLETPNYPNKGSRTLLKQIDSKAKVFATLNFSSGYYQVPIKKEDQDLCAILLPQGQFRLCRTANSTKPAGDIFNIVSDPELHRISWASGHRNG